MFGRNRRKKQAAKVLAQIALQIENASAELENLTSWVVAASSKPAIPNDTLDAERERLLSDVARLRDEMEVQNWLAGRPQAW
jgi:hypothetical protein